MIGKRNARYINPFSTDRTPWLTWPQRISRDATEILGTATGVCHEALHMSIDILSVAPVAGLGDAARTLLCIWDAFQKVEVSISRLSAPTITINPFIDKSVVMSPSDETVCRNLALCLS